MDAPTPLQRVIQFGVFQVDLSAGELRKHGIRVRLQEQPFQVLQLLLERCGEVVTREDLRQRLWPSNTFVDFDHGLNNAIKRLREALCDLPESPAYVETVARRGYRFIGSIISGAASRIGSLAVLPLDNLSRDPEQEYLADGLTEALITSLTKIGALRVVSRTSAMQYKGVHRSVREIARELHVDGIVEGTVLRSGDRVRISAQLVDAASEQHLWAESYDRDLRDVLSLQSEVARAIAREIQVTLTPQDNVRLGRAQAVDPKACEAYLKGRYYWNKRSPGGVKKSADYFQQAIHKDANYAAAYAGLADSGGVAGFWGFVSPDEGCRAAKAAACKALEIDETAEAHASLAWATLHYDWDFTAAEKEFRHAIELNPRYASAHQWYAHLLTYIGRLDEAEQEAILALQLDPLSLIINTTYAGVFWMMRAWDRAIEKCRIGLELDPNFAGLRWMLAHVYQGKGMFAEAIRERQLALEIVRDAPIFLADLGGTYAAAGMRTEALQVLDQLQELARSCYVTPYCVALIYAGLKDIDEAFLWIEKAFQEHSSMLVFAKMDFRLDYLRTDPRFQSLLRRMSFPP